MVATAPRVVLAAGALGTLRLLFAARDRERTLPDLPAALGKGFTPNGDMAAWVDRAAGPVDSSHGPSVCAYHQVRDPAGHHPHVVAEVGLPLAALPVPGRVRRRLSRSSVLFGMGRDRVAGKVRFDGRHLRIDVDRLADAEFFSDLEDTMHRIGTGYRPRRFFSKAPYRRNSRSLVSVHPLGGAPAADSIDHGVVDHTGEVFGHRGLFVADGSLYPAAPGLPPSMTIAAALARPIALVWRGKRFEEDHGTNLWLSGRAPVEFVRFKARQDEDGNEGATVRFDYELATNPRLVRPITAELRVLAPGLYLARMDYTLRGRKYTILYFTLEH